MSLVVHNNELKNILQDAYTPAEIQALFAKLQQHGTFHLPILPNGLFPAADLTQNNRYTGYGNVWVRDNVYVAYAHFINGEVAVAIRNIKTLASYFIQQSWRIKKILSGELDPSEPMNRPHIRFNGYDLSEISQPWAHAENDALGYFLWLFCTIHCELKLIPSKEEQKLVLLMVRYFAAIKFWQDEDSGHWEEKRKIEASSIGVVTGALIKLKKFREQGINALAILDQDMHPGELETLIQRGMESLHAILPAECIQSAPDKYRPFDAALLFLIYPIRLIEGELADKILSNVEIHLQGNYGIRRYLGDSFWAADYKDKLPPEKRTADFSENMSQRDSLLSQGEEAQWCIFDPIMSVIYGKKYNKYKEERFLELQTFYFNRSLGQLTGVESNFGAYKCPELYYLEKGTYVHNDTVPLLWTQANLWMACTYMAHS